MTSEDRAKSLVTRCLLEFLDKNDITEYEWSEYEYGENYYIVATLKNGQSAGVAYHIPTFRK